MFPSSPHYRAGVVVDRESQGGRHTGSCVPVKVSMGEISLLNGPSIVLRIQWQACSIHMYRLVAPAAL